MTENERNNVPPGKRLTDRVVTDSVYSRFRPLQVHCDACDVDIVGNSETILKHFNASHPSDEYCRYCKGKVFRYTQIDMSDTEDNKPKEYIYHRCKPSE